MADPKKSAQPLFDNVILKRVDLKKTTEGGIVLPDSIDNTSYECEVLEIGPDCNSVKKGDIVLVGHGDGLELDLGALKVRIVHEEKVLAKVTVK